MGTFRNSTKYKGHVMLAILDAGSLLQKLNTYEQKEQTCFLGRG